jgi:hypothetical protein
MKRPQRSDAKQPYSPLTAQNGETVGESNSSFAGFSSHRIVAIERPSTALSPETRA